MPDPLSSPDGASEPLSGLAGELGTALIGTYTLERELGGGGMSRVFVAEERALGRRVVIKFLAPELLAGLSADRFAREVRLAANLQHPCIVPLLSAGLAGDVPYYSMPLVEGESLRTRLARSEELPLGEGIKILRDMASAMAYAHERGIVHRDIKPDNVLLSGGYALVADFGIARAVDGARGPETAGESTLTQIGTSIGTPAYMSPEQAAGDRVDARSDIYSWGVVAFEVLGGTHPFAGHTTPRSLLTAHMSEVPLSLGDIRRDIPAALADLVREALSKDPAARPASAPQLIDRLDALGSVDTGARSKLNASSLDPHADPVLHRAVGSRRAIVSAAAAIALLAVAAWGMMRMRAGAASAANDASIAVLPFATLGGDTSDVYFGDGMADELTSALAKIPDLRVVSRSSAAAYRGKDARAVRAGLHVANVLEGTVRRAAGMLRVSAQLTRATDGSVLWSEQYDRPAANVFAVQDDIAASIVGALRSRLGTSAPTRPLVVSGTRNPEAHEAYLRGKYLFSRRGADNLVRARALLEQATRLDPSYADAFAALAMVFYAMPDWVGMDPDSANVLGSAAARRALAINPRQADAHAALGGFALGRDNPASAREFALAIAGDSLNAVTYHWRGLLEAGNGDLAGATASLARAHALDPLAPHIQWTYATLLHAIGRTKEAQTQLEQLVATHPQHQEGRTSLALLYLESGRRAAALAQIDSAHIPERPAVAEAAGTSLDLIGILGYLRARSGDTVASRRILAAVREAKGDDADGMKEFAEAKIRLGLGETDSTFAAMARAARRSKLRLPFFALDPAYAGLMSDARWGELYRASGFEWSLRRQ